MGIGTIEVIIGPMGSNKTTKMIDEHADDPSSYAFLPRIDTRSDGALKSHDGLTIKENVKSLPVLRDSAKLLKSILDIIKDKHIERICFDETNFFPQALISVIEKLASMEFNVHAAGLLLDSELKDFGPTREIAMLADKTTHLFAKCDITGENNAVYNYAKVEKTRQIQVGAFDLYGASAPKHLNDLRVSNGHEPIPDEIVFSEIWKVK